MTHAINNFAIPEDGLRYHDPVLSEEDALKLQATLGTVEQNRQSLQEFGMFAAGTALTLATGRKTPAISTISTELQASTEKEEESIKDRPTAFNEGLHMLGEEGVWYTEDIETQAYALRRKGMEGIEAKFQVPLETLYTRDYASQVMLRVMRDRKNGKEEAKITDWGEKQDAWKLWEFSMASAVYLEELMKKYFEEEFELCKLEADGNSNPNDIEKRHVQIFPSKNVGEGNTPDNKNIEFTEEGKRAILLKLLNDPQASEGRIAFTAWLLGIVSSDELGMGFYKCTQDILLSQSSESFLTRRKPSEIEIPESGKISWHSIVNVHDNKGEEISLDGVVHSYNEPNWKDRNWRQIVVQKMRNTKTIIDE